MLTSGIRSPYPCADELATLLAELRKIHMPPLAMMLQDLTASNLLVDDCAPGGGMRLLFADPAMAQPIRTLKDAARWVGIGGQHLSSAGTACTAAAAGPGPRSYALCMAPINDLPFLHSLRPRCPSCAALWQVPQTCGHVAVGFHGGLQQLFRCYR